MVGFKLVWICANDISKAVNESKEIKFFLIDKKIDLEIEYVIIDRLSEDKIQHKWIDEENNRQIKYLRSSKKTNIYKDLKFVIKGSAHTYILVLPDDDQINISGLINFLFSISKLPKENLFLAIPQNPIYERVNFNKLKSGKKYSFWQYQYARGYNLAYYSPMLIEQLNATIDKIINSTRGNWYYPNWDQIRIWIFLDNGRKYISTLDGFYLFYDNKNWESQKNKFFSYERMEINFLKNFEFSLNQIFSSVKNLRDFSQFIRWIKFLLFYQFNIFKKCNYIPLVLLIILKVLFNKLIDNRTIYKNLK